MGIRFIALDIDGTLLSGGHDISRENREAIQRAMDAGVAVTIATGRGYQASKHIIDELNLKAPVIVFGGAMVADAGTGKMLSLEALSSEAIQKAFAFGEENDVHVQLYHNDIVYAKRSCAFFLRYTGFYGLKAEVDPALLERQWENVPKILAYEPDPLREEWIRDGFAKALDGVAAVSKTEPGYIEINSPAASKGNALQKVTELLGISREETAALGDSYLDMSMLQWAGEGVAVENALQPVKAIADRVVPSVFDHGVAYYINHFVL